MARTNNAYASYGMFEINSTAVCPHAVHVDKQLIFSSSLRFTTWLIVNHNACLAIALQIRPRCYYIIS